MSNIVRRSWIRRVTPLLAVPPLVACATVTSVKVNDATRGDVVGERYYLPKPFIQVAPQKDGTVAVSVLYLPDKSRAYAIDARSWFSSYSLQVLPNPDGTLSGVYYQGDTTAVVQQAVTSAGSLATQVANYQLGEMQAKQTAVNTAQAAVDLAQASADAAQAALTSDTARNAAAVDPTKPPVTETALAADASTASQAEAKLAVAKAALQRVQSQAVVPSGTLSPGAVVTGPSALAPDGTFKGPAGQSWMLPAVPLPTARGAVVHAVNDTIDAKQREIVSLTAMHAVVTARGTTKATQQVFPVSYNGLGPPTLVAPSAPFVASDNTVVLSFSRPVVNAASERVLDASGKIVASKFLPPLTNSNQSVQIDVTGLKAGTYTVTMTVGWSGGSGQKNTIPADVKTQFVLQ